MKLWRYSKFLAGIATSLVLLTILSYSARAAAGDTTRLSVASDGTQGNNTSGYAGPYSYDNSTLSLSSDGRYVAFTSAANNLVPGDSNNGNDVFVHDRQSGQTARVSVASDGTQLDYVSFDPSISADGRYVAFVSSGPGTPGIFIHDGQTGQTTRASVASDGTEGNNAAYMPSISADGRYVAFWSWANNLVSGDTNGSADAFVHDTQTGQTTRASVASDGMEGNNAAYMPSISSDGRYVVFWSWANNLVSGDTNGFADAFVHDTQTGQTIRASVASDGTQSNGPSGYPPSISADGRFVAFESGASNLVSGDTLGFNDIFIHDMQTGQTTRASVPSDGTSANNPSSDPSISADGRYVAFYSSANNLVSGDSNGYLPDVFIHDMQTGQTTLASVASDGTAGNNPSYTPSISANGRYVAFISSATNLVIADTNGFSDVFVHDMETGQTTLASIASDGTQANSQSYFPAYISADGQYVAFTSYSSNLVNGDTNGYADVFEHEMGWISTPYSISGRVTDGAGIGISGVSISVGAWHTTMTDESGNYSLSGLAAGTYNLTPTKDGLFFTPPTREVVVSGDMAVNFTAYLCIAPSGLNVCELQPGDILLERSPTYAAVFSIGGTYFTHAAMYLGAVAAPGGGPETSLPRLAEGQGYTDIVQDQVWETALTSHAFWSGDNLLDWAVIRPHVSDTVKQDVIQIIRGIAANENVTFDIDAPKWTSDKFYCSKLVWYSYLSGSGVDLEVNMGLGSSFLDWWVTPDDLYFSVVKGSTLVQSKLGLSYDRILLTLWSPAHIMLVDPSGLRTGYDPVSGTILSEIPFATYTAPPDSEVETISGIGVGKGWKVIVTGYDDGEYKLEYRYLEAGTLDIIKTNHTEPGQVEEYAIEDPLFGIYLPLINR